MFAMKLKKDLLLVFSCLVLTLCAITMPAKAIGSITVAVPPTSPWLSGDAAATTIDLNEYVSLSGVTGWRVEDPDGTGIAVKNDGTLYVYPTSQAGNAVVIATNGTQEDRTTVTVTRDEDERSLYSASISLSGPNTNTAPAFGAAPLKLTCTSAVYGYYGMPMTENDVERTYYLIETLGDNSSEPVSSLHGITIDPQTGEITIPWTADACSIYVGVLYHTKLFTVGSGQASATHTTLTVMTPASSLNTGFSDVPASSYCALPVKWAVANKITNGTSASRFSPNQTCTRGHIITFLWRAAGSPTPTIANPFTDVPVGTFCTDAAVWAYEKGLVSGSEFLPSDACTRAMAMEFMWRLNGAPTNEKSLPFTDVSASDSYADAIAWAVETGVTKGTTATTFSPEASCTRGQIVTFLFRAFR